MKRYLFMLYGVIFISFQPSESLRCHTTGVSWTNNCTLNANERWKTDPACLSAIVLDEYNNPMEVLECSRYGAGNELPGGCENMRKTKIVKSCSLCNIDNCNYPGQYNSAIKFNQPLELIFALYSFAAIQILRYC